MNRTTVVTGAWGPRRQFYIDNFVAAFDRFWPEDIDLLIYADAPVKLPKLGNRLVLVHNLNRSCPGYSDFIQRHENQLMHNGCEARRGWKRSEIRAGYSFRFDAVKFAGQAFAPAHAMGRLPDGDLMIWLDADVSTFAKVPAGWIDAMVAGHDGVYLGRPAKHSEIGFWAVRLRPKTRTMIETFVGLYRSDALFQLDQWHSAFVWDRAREGSPAIDMHSLTPRGEGHVWFQSALKQYTDHLKGRRKEVGRSAERRA